MINVINKISARGANQNADIKYTKQDYSNRNSKKIKPGYYSEWLNCPNGSPTFISIDWECLNYIRYHHGICLLCNKGAELYDLSFCEDKEIWVLFLNDLDFYIARRLAYAVLRNGAVKVQIIPFDKNLIKRDREVLL